MDLEDTDRSKEQLLQYRNLVDNTLIGVYQTNLRGEILFVNQASAEMLGYDSPEELRSVNATALYRHPEERKILIGTAEKSGKLRNYDIELVTKSGEPRNIILSGILDGENISGTLVDITARRKAEEALKESETRFRFMAETTSAGIYVRRGMRLIYANPAVQSITGYSEEELLSGDISDLIHPDYRDLVKSYAEMRRSGKNAPSQYEVKIIIKGGEERWAEISAGLRDYGGETIVIGTVFDITELKQAEEERRKLIELLHRAEKMEALGALAGGVAHDLNNILGVIVGYSELLRDEVQDEKTARRAASIMSSGMKASAIVQDMLTLTRRGIHSRKILNLNSVISEQYRSPEFEKMISFHPMVRMENHLDPELRNIPGSPVQIGKALFNLASNAMEAMPNGGLLTVRTGNQYLDRPIQGYEEIKEGDYAVIMVSDTGEGISDADLKRIFEPFYTKKVMGRSGTGLGLAVVWGTVKDHNGYVDVRTEAGKGTVFTLYFPVAKEAVSKKTSIAVSEYAGNGESILVVDDVKEQRMMACEMLKKLDYKVVSADGGEEAVEYLKSRKVDLIILDMIMNPGMDGLDTYKKIIEIHPGQKSLIVSGYAETERVVKAQELGAGAYVRKPYELEKIGLAVRKELDKKIVSSQV
ncbi:MAG TPA: PAS domain S-box protein [Syntrophales bacterium]|nr:PAS domain S-box protein [Syntrophales bacterium]